MRLADLIIAVTLLRSILNLIASYDWNNFLRSYSQQEIYSNFIQLWKTFTDCSTKVITVKKRRSELEWLNDNIISAIKYKDLLRKGSRQSPKYEELRIKFKIERNRVTAIIKSDKRNYVKTKLVESHFDSRVTWSLVNELRGGHSAKRSVDETVERYIPGSPLSAANAFNTYFGKTSCVLRDNDVVSSPSINTNVASALLPELTELSLQSLLLTFKPRLSPGIDGVRMSDLCRNYNSVKNILLHMLNGFIASGVLPDDLKTAIVKPLYKNGDRGRVESYRPISILPSIVKILEKHISLTMTAFMNKFNLFSPQQYGFVGGKGTQPLLEDFSDLLNTAFDNNLVTCALFLDV